MPAPFWDNFTDGYEGPPYPQDRRAQCQLAGYALPGRAAVDGSAKKRLQVMKANGADGGALVERGYTPGELDIDLTMWTPEQWDTWQRILPVVFRKPNKLDLKDHKEQKTGAKQSDLETTKTSSVSIVNWKAQSLNIATVIVTQVGLPKENADGSVTVTIKCTEYVPPKKGAKAKPRKVVGANNDDIKQPEGQKFGGAEAAATKTSGAPSRTGDGEPDSTAD
jgi:hypothetical protein